MVISNTRVYSYDKTKFTYLCKKSAVQYANGRERLNEIYKMQSNFNDRGYIDKK